MLRPEHRADIDPGGGERVEAVGQLGGDRGGMREQRDALAFERFAKRRVGEQAVDTEKRRHARQRAFSVRAKTSGCWKSGLPAGRASSHKLFVPSDPPTT